MLLEGNRLSLVTNRYLVHYITESGGGVTEFGPMAQFVVSLPPFNQGASKRCSESIIYLSHHCHGPSRDKDRGLPFGRGAQCGAIIGFGQGRKRPPGFLNQQLQLARSQQGK
jgi:hypothetical protein